MNDIDNTPEECKFVGGRFAIPLDDVADILENEGVHSGGIVVIKSIKTCLPIFIELQIDSKSFQFFQRFKTFN